MAGLRLGYAVSANAGLREKIGEQSQPWKVSVVAQGGGGSRARRPGVYGKIAPYDRGGAGAGDGGAPGDGL